MAYISSTCVLKISIGVFLIRICVRTSQQITIWIVMAIQTVFSIIYFFVIVFQCTPVIYFWTMYSGGSGTCLASTIIADFTYAHSAISVFTDWTLGVLPVFLVWNLKMNARTKISVAIILALGAMYVSQPLGVQGRLTSSQWLHCNNCPHSIYQTAHQYYRLPLRHYVGRFWHILDRSLD